MKGVQYFLAELKRRNLLRVAAFYGGASWLLAQIATQILPVFGVSQGPLRVIVILLIAAFPFVMLFAWFYELTPHGIKLEKDVERSESITRTTGKKLDRIIILVLSLATASSTTSSASSPRSPPRWRASSS